jgi:hypothetical protein
MPMKTDLLLALLVLLPLTPFPWFAWDHATNYPYKSFPAYLRDEFYAAQIQTRILLHRP